MVWVDGLRATLLQALLPGRCALCGGAARELLCAPCAAELPWNRVACPRCAKPQNAPAAFLCGRCTVKPPPFEQAWSAFRYAWPVSAAVHRLKYHADFRSARWLGGAMAQALSRRTEPLPELLLPVPLHHWRLHRRGYNQAVELAQALGRALSLPVEAGAAERVRATEDQIGKSAVQRRRSVKGAFAADPARLRERHVALVDDVMTTGSTLAELAAECRRAGAARVEVWTAARAV